eukprot:13352046-Alexandrium_andersonii.AAC.1
MRTATAVRQWLVGHSPPAVTFPDPAALLRQYAALQAKVRRDMLAPWQTAAVRRAANLLQDLPFLRDVLSLLLRDHGM